MKPKKENKKGGAIRQPDRRNYFRAAGNHVLHRGHGLSAWRQSKRFE